MFGSYSNAISNRWLWYALCIYVVAINSDCTWFMGWFELHSIILANLSLYLAPLH